MVLRSDKEGLKVSSKRTDWSSGGDCRLSSPRRRWSCGDARGPIPFNALVRKLL